MAGAFEWLDTGDASAPPDQGGAPVGGNWLSLLGQAVNVAGQVAVIKATAAATADVTPVRPTSPTQTVVPLPNFVIPALLLGGAILVGVLLTRK